MVTVTHELNSWQQNVRNSWQQNVRMSKVSEYQQFKMLEYNNGGNPEHQIVRMSYCINDILSERQNVNFKMSLTNVNV